MVTISRVLTVSTLAALAASSLFFMGGYALGGASGTGVVNARQGGISNNAPAATVVLQSRVPSVRVKTHVLLVSQALLNKVQVDYNLLVPTHHVRPDTAETLSNAALIDESTVGRLLEIAHCEPENLDYSPAPQDYPEDEDEFDCLSDMFRGPEAHLPPELSSSVINGLSMAYTFSASPDRSKVVLAPVTLMRADYPAEEIPNTAAHEAKYDHHVTISVPNGGTLLIDAGSVKANRSETTPSRHVVVLVQSQWIKPGQENLSAKPADRTPTPIPMPAASLAQATVSH